MGTAYFTGLLNPSRHDEQFLRGKYNLSRVNVIIGLVFKEFVVNVNRFMTKIYDSSALVWVQIEMAPFALDSFFSFSQCIFIHFYKNQ